jgi:hypothetical protein
MPTAGHDDREIKWPVAATTKTQPRAVVPAAKAPSESVVSNKNKVEKRGLSSKAVWPVLLAGETGGDGVTITTDPRRQFNEHITLPVVIPAAAGRLSCSVSILPARDLQARVASSN